MADTPAAIIWQVAVAYPGNEVVELRRKVWMVPDRYLLADVV
jgi:hypothetical protein